MTNNRIHENNKKAVGADETGDSNSTVLGGSSIDSNTTTVTRTRAFSEKQHRNIYGLTDEDIEHIAIMYKKHVGLEINCTIGAFIRGCCARGMKRDVICDAIEKTGWAPHPSPYYLRAILQRYLNEGILTMQDVAADEHDREIEKRYYKDKTSWFY